MYTQLNDVLVRFSVITKTAQMSFIKGYDILVICQGVHGLWNKLQIQTHKRNHLPIHKPPDEYIFQNVKILQVT